MPIMTLAIMLASDLNARALEGLKLSVQGCNVVLCWPSLPGQNYIVQYRPSLDPGTPWRTLTNAYPAAWTTNRTVFVHSNAVQYPKGGSGSLAVKSLTQAPAASLTASALPKVMPADGTGAAVPMAIYPPGFDFSGYVLATPATSGKVGEIGLAPTGMTPLSGGPAIPKGGSMDGGGGNDAPTAPEPGFYQVVQDGVKIADSSLAMLTNGLLSNTVTIKFEAGNADPNNGTNVYGGLSSATLFVDGQTFDGCATLGDSIRPWTFAFDTAYLENGDHTVQIMVSWEDTNSSLQPFFSRWSDPVSITVSNQIYYPDWEPQVGEAGISAYFFKTTCTNADWSIAIYDVHSNLVQTLTGHTTDGTVEAYWNMVDKNGVTRTNADVDPEFSSIITVADPITKKTPKKEQARKSWPEHGKWTVSYQDYFKHFYDANNANMGSINAFANTTAKYGGYYLYYPQPGQTNDVGQTYPLRYNTPGHPEDTNATPAAIALDQQLLLRYLSSTNSRNFYYNGHASPHTFDKISVERLKNAIKHRYRWVFINGCESAKGDLGDGFGIKGHKRFDLGYYQKTGMRPAVFMGYTDKVYFAGGGPVTQNGIRYDGTIPWQVPGFITNYIFYWDLYGYGVMSARDWAKSGLPSVYGQYREDLLEIYGYYDLRIDEYNHRDDVWW